MFTYFLGVSKWLDGTTSWGFRKESAISNQKECSQISLERDTKSLIQYVKSFMSHLLNFYLQEKSLRKWWDSEKCRTNTLNISKVWWKIPRPGILRSESRERGYYNSFRILIYAAKPFEKYKDNF